LNSDSISARQRTRFGGLSVSSSTQAWATLLFVAALATTACGPRSIDSNDSNVLAVTGRYTLELTPAASCIGIKMSFPVEVTRSAEAPHPGVQLLISGGDPELPLELELKHDNDRLEGGIGTTGDGVLMTRAGPWVWVNAIAAGRVTRATDGRGEVVGGTLMGHLEIEGIMNACDVPNHTFALRAR
jgi:hypothetical protein